ncbi:MAG: UDP-glucose/GDP-mannose dehydrogenase family protein [bacterium]
MKIACIGTGFVGIVTSAVFAKLGHDVVGLDIDPKKIESLKSGKVPFFEPSLENLLIETQKSGHLTFTTNYAEGVSGADIVMIMVGTPSAPDGQADLKYVRSVAESSAPYLKNGAIVIIKSTVPPGTNKQIHDLIAGKTKVNFDIASVPEFLKEGTAVEDTLHPDRVIIGSENPHTIKILTDLHAPLTSKIIVMRPESAQMAKYAGNVYLAMRITFANQMADLCEKNGADVQEVIKGIGTDSRIGDHYWYPGLGYGGSCFPKDVKEIAAYAKSIGETESIFIAVDERNDSRIPRLLEKYDQLVGGFSGKTVAVLGLSFKKNTNDTRVAPALRVIPWLIDHGAKVITADPQVPADTADPYQAAMGAHILMLLVEWDQFQNLDLAKLASLMHSPKYFLDTRNQYDPTSALAAGLQYKSIGR